MKKNIVWITVITVIIGFLAFKDYYWGYNALKNSDFKVICTKTDWTPLKPWTWIKPPITQILWLDQALPLSEDKNYYLARIFYKRQGDDLIETLDVVDIKHNRFAGIERKDVQNLLPDTLDKLQYIKAEGCVSELVEYLKIETK